MPDLRELLVEVLRHAGDMEVVGEAEDGDGGVRLAEELQPDVVLLDVTMPGVDGLEAIPRIRACAPRTAIAVLSGLGAHQMAARAADLGAHVYVEKGAELAEISAAVREAAGVYSRTGEPRSGSVNQTMAPGDASSIHSVPP